MSSAPRRSRPSSMIGPDERYNSMATSIGARNFGGAQSRTSIYRRHTHDTGGIRLAGCNRAQDARTPLGENRFLQRLAVADLDGLRPQSQKNTHAPGRLPQGACPRVPCCTRPAGRSSTSTSL